MPKKSARKGAKSAKGSGAMRTLIVDNGSKYVGKIESHVNSEANEQGIEHEVVRLSVDKLQEAYNKGDTGVVKGFGYIISSGSGKYRKIDAEIHKFISDNKDPGSVYLGVCHGGQQTAVAHGAKLKKTKHMHRGNRESTIVSGDSVLEDSASDGKMTNYGHHKWYLPVEEAGSQLEVIAESQSEHTGEKFVEMYKIKGKDEYGTAFHPEKGKGEVIRGLFRKAYQKQGIVGKVESSAPEYKKAA